MARGAALPVASDESTNKEGHWAAPLCVANGQVHAPPQDMPSAQPKHWSSIHVEVGPLIRDIAHTAYWVRDLDAALRFYCDILGMKEAFRLEKDGKVWIVYLQVARNSFIELFPDPTFRAEGHSSYQHLCLEVDDLRKTLDELAARGLDIQGEPKQGQDKNWQFWIKDPDGNPIELMEISPESPQAAAGREWPA